VQVQKNFLSIKASKIWEQCLYCYTALTISRHNKAEEEEVQEVVRVAGDGGGKEENQQAETEQNKQTPSMRLQRRLSMRRRWRNCRLQQYRDMSEAARAHFLFTSS
jgi:biotin synthase-like enzyme